jgi:hypothetical protein
MAEHKMEVSGDSQKPEEKQEDIPVKQISPATVKKPSLAKKFTNTFFKGNLKSAGSYVFSEIIVPKSKDILSDVAYQMIQNLIYGQAEAYTQQRRSPYISYNKISRDEHNRYSSYSQKEPSSRNKHHDFYDLGFDYEDQASEVVSQLIDIFDNNARTDRNGFGYASVADLYRITGMQSSFLDYRWGWTELNDYPRQYYRWDSRAKQFFLALPPTENLDEARRIFMSDRWN